MDTDCVLCEALPEVSHKIPKYFNVT